ncbi:glycosyltransferase family 1 protein [Patescibacteria group bacterium]|nr:glycosyltransferase family 1 protein [Patescibacteria group bacterium]
MSVDIREKIKVLFIADKWCAGNIDFGLSEWEGNLWSSLKSLDIAQVDVFHLDDYYRLHNKNGDNALLNKVDDFRPNLIFLIIYRMPGSDKNVPKCSTLDKIKNIFKIPMVAIWGDLEIPEQVSISKMLLPYIEFNVATASSAALARINIPQKYIYMWVPKNKEYFNNTGANHRDIDLSYVGSPKLDRLAKIRYLEKNNIRVMYGGGERQQHFSLEEYANILKRSKITLSFSRATYSHVINARPFEAMLCGTMVLEELNFETPKLYTPFVDYVPYVSKADLLEKAKYYLSHIDEAKIIANNGNKKTETLYSAKRFWDLIINKVLFNESIDNWTSKLPSLNDADLSRLPHKYSKRLKVLDRICRNRISFFIYFNLVKIVDFRFYLSKAIALIRAILPDSVYRAVLSKVKVIFKKILIPKSNLPK